MTGLQALWFIIILCAAESFGTFAMTSTWRMKMRMIGRILDETSYKRDDKHVNIDNVINIDFIREHKEIHEIKKSKAIEEAGIWQTKYYLYYLKQRGVTQLKAKIDYPLLRKNIVVELSAEDEEKMRGVLDDIILVKKRETVPQLEKKKICKKCAYYDLCFI